MFKAASSNCLDYHNVETDNVNCYKSGTTIHFCDQISWNTVVVLNKLLLEVEAEIMAEVDKVKSATSSKYCVVEPCHITLFLTTYGGTVHAALSVVDMIQSLKVKVHTVIQGYVASAGTLISMSGAKRFIGKNAYILIHELRCEIWGKYNEIEIQKENAAKLMDHLIDYYISQRINMNKEELKAFLSKDVDLNATDAIKFGLADSLFEPQSRP